MPISRNRTVCAFVFAHLISSLWGSSILIRPKSISSVTWIFSLETPHPIDKTLAPQIRSLHAPL